MSKYTVVQYKFFGGIADKKVEDFVEMSHQTAK